MKLLKDKRLFISCIFICVFVLTFLYQNTPKPEELTYYKLNLEAKFVESRALNVEATQSLKKVAAYCKLGNFSDCDKNLMLISDIYDSFLPRPPSGDKIYDTHFTELRALKISPTKFTFEFSTDSTLLKSEDYYLTLINRCISERFLNDITRKEIKFNLEAEAMQAVSKDILSGSELASQQVRLKKIKEGMAHEFKTLRGLVALEKNPQFLEKVSLDTITLPRTQDTTLLQKILISFLLGAFFTIYCWAFYDFYKKSK